MEKEAKFMKRVNEYIDENGFQHIYDPVAPKGRGILPGSIILPKVSFTKEDMEEYKKSVTKSLLKHKSLYARFKNLANVEVLIYRYDKLGFLNNISLSVHPNIKSKWGITHELFGAFYNSDYPHCSLFPDLEDSLGNALKFKPEKNMVLLVNPPYTVPWIKWCCKKLKEWKGICKIICVIPIWDLKSREQFGYKTYGDFPEIQDLISISDSHEMVNMKFYDGLRNKPIELKDKVHVIKLN